MRVYQVSEWQGLDVENDKLTRRHAAGILIHHTATANRVLPAPRKELAAASALARGIQRDHMNRNGWRDSGHHFLISRGGRILEGRNETLAAARNGWVILGAHSGNVAINGTWWGIEVEGSYGEENPPTPAWEALIELCARLCHWGGVQTSNILGHRAVRATECPGDMLYAMLPLLRARAHERKQVLVDQEAAST